MITLARRCVGRCGCGRWLRLAGHLPAVYELVGRLRHRTGIVVVSHWFGGTYATWMFRRGAGMESMKELLGNVSVTNRSVTALIRSLDSEAPWR